MENIALLGPELDLKHTSQNANIFLREDFQHYLNLSGQRKDQLSSPQLSFAPGSKSSINNIEKTLINQLSNVELAGRAVRAIYCSMDNCTQTMQKPFRSILLSAYVKDRTISEIAMRTSLADSTVKRKKAKALCEFAERLVFWKKEFDCEFLPELRVWKNRSDTKTVPK